MRATERVHKMGSLHMECSGCDATADVPVNVEIRTEPLGPRWVKTITTLPKLVDLIPDGWVASDQYTHLTYCDVCWGAIAADISEAVQS